MALDFPYSLFGDFASIIYRIYPYRLQKGKRLWCDMITQFVLDLENAKIKVLISYSALKSSWYKSVDIGWFNTAVDLLKKDGVIIVVVSEENPPVFLQKLIDKNQISFLKSGHGVPFTGYIIDNKIIDISFIKEAGLAPSGHYWRTERAMPDLAEFLTDAILSGTSC